MKNYALDTNIISFMLRGNRHIQDRVCSETDSGANIIIPWVAYYEIKRSLIASNAQVKLTAFEQLCCAVGIGTLEIKTLDIAAEIYATLKKAGRLVEDAYILIAAFCLTHDYVLVSDNTRHFEQIPSLNLVNWTSVPPD